MPVPTLEVSGARLRAIDEEILRLVQRRLQVSQDVIRFKKSTGERIVRPEVEAQRIIAVGEIAETIGLNPDFARALEHMLISESCKVQIDALQSERIQILPLEPDERYLALKENLIRLTCRVADTYNSSGGNKFPATRLYVDYENDHILGQIKKMSVEKRIRAIDLGCAAGRTTRFLAPHFQTVVGYDISQDMINTAWAKCENASPSVQNAQFIQHDLDYGIPEDDDSVDMTVMGLGTASDMRNLPFIIKEIGRVLKTDGEFILSFYNKDALIYTPGFISIDPSLNARINIDEECLQIFVPPTINMEGEQIPGAEYLIYARAYDWSEIETMVGSPLRIKYYRTHPTLASITPRLLLENTQLTQTLSRLERTLEYGGAGAYYLISGTKE
jgi:SAM-dependent methyltransferase